MEGIASEVDGEDAGGDGNQRAQPRRQNVE